MFSYRPPKNNIWGHAIRPKDPVKAKLKVNAFFKTYFEQLDPEWDVTRQLTFELNWNTSVLPGIEWHEEFLGMENGRWQKVLFMLTGDRISFMLGLLFPVLSTEPASYAFLKRFSEDAPFKMSAKYFQVSTPVGNKGKWAWRKPDAEIYARLQDAVG